MLKPKFLLDLIFPVTCQGCQKEGSYLCLDCQEKIKPPLLRCFICGKGSLLGATHDSCKKENWALSGVIVAAEYGQESVRNLIWNFKYNSVKDIGEILTLLLADYFVRQNLQDYFAAGTVIPVPLHKRRLRWRGFNQAEFLAAGLSARLGFEYLPILKRTRHNPRQVDLERDKRLQNVSGIFEAIPHPSLGERKIILVDDVVTTGATLNECAKVLRKQSPGEIWGLVVARN